MRFLLLLFIVVPVVEMWLLIEVGSIIGAFPTIALVLLTAMIGLALLRREGLSTLMRGNRKLDRGELPAQEMLEGLVLAVSGALLLTPGFFTDFVGFLGLIPLTRQLLVKRLVARGMVQTFSWSGVRRPPYSSSRDDNVIEGEYRRRDDRDDD